MIVTRDVLVSIRRVAMRRRVWFRALNPLERAVVNLTIKCVERVKSAKLAKIVTAIVEKVEEAVESVVERLTERVGRPLACKLSLLAVGWGNRKASGWGFDRGFMRFLAVNYMNSPTV